MSSYYKAQCLADGKWVEGCLVYNPNLTGFAYIIPFDEVNKMCVKDEVATVKMIRVMEKSVELIILANKLAEINGFREVFNE